MENNTLYTRCPTCTTAFKVTEKLLSMAGGKVRCGACLAIFQATDYMLKPSEKAAHQAESTSSTEQATAKPEPSGNQSHIDPTDDLEPNFQSAEAAKPSHEFESEPEFQEASANSFDAPEFESEPEFEPNTNQHLPDDFEIEPDFQTDSEFETGSDNQPSDVKANEPEGTSPSADPEIDIERVTDVEQEVFTDDQGGSTEQPMSDFDYQNQSSDFNDQPAEFDQVIEQAEQMQRTEPSLGDADDFQPEPIDTEMDQLDPNSDDSLKSEPLDDFSAGGDELIDEDLSTDDLSADDRAVLDETRQVVAEEQLGVEIVEEQDIDEQLESNIEPHFGAENELPSDPKMDSEFDSDPELDSDHASDHDLELDDSTPEDLSDQLAEQMQQTDAEPDPLDEFENIVEEKNTDLRRNVIIAAVTLVVFIVLQQLWSNRQSLAWSESWGGTVKSVCQFLPCDLKERRDVAKIKLLQRQLAPDEQNENQLDVKVLLTNEASFDQPYPTIKIAFSNKNGERVAIKSFPPDYYLQADAVNKLMPSGTEVHIHFKTELTHPDALGFEFIFE